MIARRRFTLAAHMPGAEFLQLTNSIWLLERAFDHDTMELT
jgi:hypothetical protein